jgi:endonuclease I
MRLLLALVALLLPATAHAQSAGDIAFVSYDAAGETFSFVALADLPSGTAITFTDNGWTAAGAFRANENTTTVTFADGLAAGTVVSNAGCPDAVFSAGSTEGALCGLSNSGDQILAYVGPADAPQFLTAIQGSAGTWDADASSSTTSALPAGLVEGRTAVAIGTGADETDTAAYVTPTRGTLAELRAALHDASTWADGLTLADAPTAFTITSDGQGTTRVRFSESERSVAEDSGALTVELLIENPSPDRATVVTIALGGGARSPDDFSISPPAEPDPLSSAERITLTFAAGSADAQTVTITPNNDDTNEPDETLTLTIVDVAGGNAAAAGSPDAFTLTLRDPDTTTDPALETIASARALPDSERVRVRGVVSRVRGDFAYFQDGTAGLALRQPEGTFQDQIARGDVSAGDSIEAVGALSTFNGLRQLNEADLEAVRVIERGVGVPEPVRVTLAELSAQGEALEAQLVRVESVRFDQSGTFAPRTTYTVTDPTGTFEVRTPNAGDTEIDGLPILSGPATLTAIVGQFDQDGSGDDFQLLPIDATDVRADGPDVPTVRFATDAAAVPESAGTFALRVERTGPTGEALRVVVRAQSQTAVDGEDIEAFGSQTVAFAAGQTEAALVTIRLVEDDTDEGTETIAFALENADGMALPQIGSPARFTLTITDAGADGTVLPGLTGRTLQARIRDDFTPTTLGYDRARDEMFGYVWNTSGSVPTLYAGRLISVAPTSGQPRGDAFAQDVNTEHIWPRSQGADDEPAFSNLFNLAPTDVRVNSDRGSLPFGSVPAGQATDWYRGTTRQTQTPTGDLSLWSRRSSSRFEPRDEVKGDVARSQFYFYTIYQDRASASYWNAVRDVLLAWHRQDPVSADELLRHDRIAEVQGLANPFVLDSTLARRAFESTSTSILPDATPRQALLLAPLPAGDVLHVRGAADARYAETFDLLGRSLARTPMAGGSAHLDVSALPAGIYLLRLTGEGGRVVEQVAFTVAR